MAAFIMWNVEAKVETPFVQLAMPPPRQLTTLDDIAEMLADHEELNIWCESGSDEWINVRSAADVDALRETPLNQPNAITA